MGMEQQAEMVQLCFGVTNNTPRTLTGCIGVTTTAHLAEPNPSIINEAPFTLAPQSGTVCTIHHLKGWPYSVLVARSAKQRPVGETAFRGFLFRLGAHAVDTNGWNSTRLKVVGRIVHDSRDFAATRTPN
jgi:hypothetical protein